MISIIVPIFNVGNKIIKFIDSLNQSTKNIDKKYYEIIFVNDCSEYNEIKNIKNRAKFKYKFLNNDKRLGINYSRYKGIINSSYEWIWMIDPDDIICNDAIYTILETLNNNHGYDAIIFNHNTLIYNDDTHQEIIKNILFNEEEKILIDDGKTLVKHNKDLRRLSYGSVWNKVFKKTKIYDNSFSWQYDGYNQDIINWIEFLSKAKKIKYVNKCIYNYIRYLNGSTATNIMENNFDIFLNNEMNIFFNVSLFYIKNLKEINKKIIKKILIIYYKNLLNKCWERNCEYHIYNNIRKIYGFKSIINNPKIYSIYLVYKVKNKLFKIKMYFK